MPMKYNLLLIHMISLLGGLYDIAYYLAVGAFLYFIIWERIIKMYYIWWFYRKQGIPCLGFPLPVIGTMHLFLRTLSRMHKDSKTPLEEYF